MKYGLVGKTLKHSFSKEIHSLIADYPYNLIELSETEFDDFFKAKDFDGVNITIPYKERVIPYLDYISDEAKSIGAVNTVVNKNGKLYGYNTDYLGLKSLIERTGDINGKTVAILGTGGTSKTAYAVCESLKAKSIVKVSRNKTAGVITYDELKNDYQSIDVIINTTPVGTYPNIFDTPIDLDGFNNLSLVIDVVYNPLETRLVQNAKEKNIKADGGLYMLVAQAVKASALFLDGDYDEKLTDKIYGVIKSQKQNIVLTGMPSSGKSTIGRILADRLGREFIDTDQLIEKNANKKIPDIIKEQGEVAFRRLERDAIKEVSKLSNKIIATGGGVILNENNILDLKLNGKIVFIDRSLDLLLPTSDRPLSSSKEDLKKRYDERYDIYLATADLTVNGDGTTKEGASEILRSI